MKLTESQNAAVEQRGSNLLVSASAGAGKTEVLARRVVSLVADPERPCEIDRLLVATFTRAAAAELRLRVGRMLRERAARTRAAGEREHLQRQEMLVEAADIGTIDAWCGRIVREHFAEAGVDVAFSVLGEQEARLLRAEVLDELFDWIHRGGEPLADEAREWIARGVAPRDDSLRKMVRKLSGYRESLIDPEPWLAARLAACDSDDSAEVLAAALAGECEFQQSQLAALIQDQPAAGDALGPYRAALGDWRRHLDQPAALPEVVQRIADFSIPKPGRKKDAPPESAAVTEVRARWFEGRLRKPWSPASVQLILRHGPRTAQLTAVLLRLEARYERMLAERKTARATYEFADVLRLALDLLGEPAASAGDPRAPTDIARRLRRRYEHILVDEYQDTSPVQVEILRLVTRAGGGQANRFMVGDVKQSIYGFRRAEPRLFTALGDEYERGRGEGRVVYLSDNFRSHPELLRSFNQLFAMLFDQSLGGTRFGPQERLTAGRADSAAADGEPRARVHVIERERGQRATSEDEGDDDQMVELLEREAQLAADEIRRLLGSVARMPQRKTDGTVEFRPPRLDDVAILLRSAKHQAGQVAEVLRANGIRCVAGGRESLLDALDVRDVCNVLRLLVNRRQDVPLAAYLRGPLVGLSESELLRVREADRRSDADLHDSLESFRRARSHESLAVRLDAAMVQLDRWALAAREEELDSVLRRVLGEGGLLTLARGLRGGAQRVALLRSFQNFATEFGAGRARSVDEFVDCLDALEAEDEDPGATAVAGADAVRIMTIHGAKGLEFPIVFLLGAGARFNRKGPQDALQCDDELGIGPRYADYEARAVLGSARHEVISRRTAQRELEEELRLLYVAATRAREQLHIIGHAKPGLWDEYRQRFSSGVVPPLISRISAANRLEWVLMAIAALGETSALHVRTCPSSEVGLPPRRPREEATEQTSASWNDDDEAWVARGWQLINAPVDSVLADYPATISVSAAKELAQRDASEDRPHLIDAPPPRLSPPRFAAGDQPPDGRELGTACHRLLELADLRLLDSLEQARGQLDGFVSAGQMAAEQARLVPLEDVAWFGASEIGRLLAEGGDRVRREVPFVYAMPLRELRLVLGRSDEPRGAAGVSADAERAIVRGIVDCLVDTPAGLVIVDYKTDRVRDEQALGERVAGYSVQLRLYARAAERVFARPVARAVLAFLRARRVIDVPLGADGPARLT